MIFCVNQEHVHGKDDLYRKVVLQADTASDIATMPTTGAGVVDLPDSVSIYPSSILVCLENSAKYVMGADSQWHQLD